MVRLSSRTLSSAAKTGKNSIKCSWTTSSQVTGYEVRFMVGGNVYKTITIGNYKTGVKTFTGLPAGKTYTIQVRSYKKVNGVGSFYSAWSTAKEVGEEAARKAAKKKAEEEAAAAGQADDVIGHRICFCGAGVAIHRYSGLHEATWRWHMDEHAKKDGYPPYVDVYGDDDPFLNLN